MHPLRIEALKLSARELTILRYIDLFKISKEGFIYRIFLGENGDSRALLLLDEEGLVKIALRIHEELGHCGKKSVSSIIKRKYYTPGMENMIKGAFERCTHCLKYNIPRTMKHKNSTLLAMGSNIEIQADLIGPLPRSNKGFRFILTVVDSCSREVHLRALKTATADEMATCLCDLFGEIGVYQRVRIDYKCLSLRQMDVKILEALGTEIIRSNNCSRAQGTVERENQKVTIRMLKLLSNEPNLSNWPNVLRTLSTALNLTSHSSLNFLSPYDLTRRFTFRFLGPGVGRVAVGMKNDFLTLVRAMEAVRFGALRNLVNHKSFNFLEVELKEGELYFRRRQSFGVHCNRKLQIKVIEAFKIISKVASGVYKVKNIVTGEIKLIPIDQLIKTNLREDEIREMLEKLSS